MIKKLLFCFLALLPFISSAQDDAMAVVKNFYKGADNGSSSFIWNDHINIMQFTRSNDKFDIVAVNDQVQLLWKTSLNGYIISACKFKDKILAVAATDYSSAKQHNNTFKGFLIDPANGKVLLEKVIYDGQQQYLTYPFIFTGDGSFFKFALRQSAVERRIHIGIAFVSDNSWSKQIRATKDMDVIEFNDKLEPVKKLKPVITDGTFINMTCNNQGDLFTAWYNAGKVNMVKYDKDKNLPSAALEEAISLDKDILDDTRSFFIEPSKKNGNILYYSFTFKNQDKETELAVGKLDFSALKDKYVNEIFTKDHTKDIRKSYVQVNKKLGTPDFGDLKGLQVRAFNDIDDHLIVTLSSYVYSRGSYGGGWTTEYSTILNNYDTDLNFKFQYIIPTGSSPNRYSENGYYHKNNKFYVITNDQQGMVTENGVYSVFDLTNGRCDKIELLSKKKIANSKPALGSKALWFNNSFVVPYDDGGDITLQQNSY